MSRRAGFMSCCNFFFSSLMKDFFPSPQLTPVIFYFFFQTARSIPNNMCAQRRLAGARLWSQMLWSGKYCLPPRCDTPQTLRPTDNIASARLLSSNTRAALFSSLFTCKEDVKHSFAIWPACTFGFQMAFVIRRALIVYWKTVKLIRCTPGFFKFLSSLTVCLYAVAIFFCSARIRTRRKDDEIFKSRAAFGASRFLIQQGNILTLCKTLICVICWTARSYPVPGSTFYPVIWCARVWTSCLWLWITKGKQHGINWTPELNQEAVERCLPVAFVGKGRTDPKVF